MSRILKAGLFTLLILGFFCLMSRIDYVVNALLYDYGLRFSYEWAIGYWVTYLSVFIVFSVVVSVAYWFGSGRTVRDVRMAVALFLTINFLTIGGLQDIMFYIVWVGSLPPSNFVWWWVPGISFLGTWNSLEQVCLTATMSCTAIFTWVLALRKPKPTKQLFLHFSAK